MANAIMTTKGQITIPVEVRNELGLKTGDCIEFDRNSQTGGFEIRRKTGTLAQLRGMLKYSGPPVSTEEMSAAIGDHLAAEEERIQREWREQH